MINIHTSVILSLFVVSLRKVVSFCEGNDDGMFCENRFLSQEHEIQARNVLIKIIKGIEFYKDQSKLQLKNKQALKIYKSHMQNHLPTYLSFLKMYINHSHCLYKINGEQFWFCVTLLTSLQILRNLVDKFSFRNSFLL